MPIGPALPSGTQEAVQEIVQEIVQEMVQEMVQESRRNRLRISTGAGKRGLGRCLSTSEVLTE